MNSSNKNIFRILVIVASLIMIFEAEIRSIGHLDTEHVQSIGLLPGVWLSDIGLFLPIFFVFLIGRFESIFFKNKMMFFLIVIFLYGLLLFLVRNNPFDLLGQDLRVFIALFTGLSIGTILPNGQKTIASSITLISASAVFIATVILFTIPGAEFISAFKRTTHPAAFILLGVPTVLIAPSIISSMLTGNKKLIAISWSSAAAFLIMSVVILQTRSTFLAVALSITIAIITMFVLSFYFNQSFKKMKSLRIVIGFLIFVVILLYWRSDNVEFFFTRMDSAVSYQEDVGIAPRLAEISTVFESMDFIDHFLGMGLNPPLSAVSWVGISYNTFHIGILNIWWRFGFPVFLAIVYLFMKLLIKWVKNLTYLYFRSSRNKVNNETLAIIVCAPGVFSLFIISCMSGGWSLSTMLPLGMLWEIYRLIASGYMRDNRFHPIKQRGDSSK